MTDLTKLSDEDLIALKDSGVSGLSDEGLMNLSAAPEVEAEESPGALGYGEAALTIASSIFAEPVAGLAGIAAAIFPGGETGAEAVESTRSALTYNPRTEGGKEAIGGIGETLEPLGRYFNAAEDYLGSTVLDATGSPALAAMAHTAPTAIMEAIGFGLAKGAKKAANVAETSKLNRALSAASPSPEKLKQVSRAVFKEIDDLGAKVEPLAYKNFANSLAKELRDSGLDKDITPKSAKALKRIQAVAEADNIPVSELDRLRKIAGNAAGAIEKSDASLGMMIRDSIDDFIETAGDAIDGPADIGARYAVARDLWGRARRSELVGEAFENARMAGSGFENGVRNEFTRLLKNRKTKKMFRPDEVKEMQKVIDGVPGANLARLAGKMAFFEGRGSGFLGGSIGVGAGSMVAGTPGAVAMPIIGHVSRKLASRLTEGGAKFADDVIRAGRDSRQIVKAYLSNTPRRLRSPEELAELLMRPDIYLADLSKADDIAVSAAQIAANRRAELIAASIAGATPEKQ